jgi:hypothetical protein
MSSLPPQAVAEFQALWKKHCGTSLPHEEAVLRANEVFAVLRLVLEQPCPDGSRGRSPETALRAHQRHATPRSHSDTQENPTRKKTPEAASLL